MSRRRVAALLAATVAVVGPSLAQPVSAAEDAATVNGESISVDEFDALVVSVADSGQFQLDADNDVIDAVQGRSALQIMITNEGRRQFLEEEGIEAISDDDRQAAGEALDQQSGGNLVGPARDVLVDQSVLASQLAEVEAPDVTALGDSYAARPASLGVLCGRIIVVADAVAGAAVVDALEAGEPVVSVGEEYSIEPDFAGTQGSITGDPEQPCLALSSIQGAGPELAGPLVGARPGEPVGPIESQAGIIVFVVDPFDDVSAAITELYEDPESGVSAGELAFAGWLLSADIRVNPRYGRWEPSTATIVPLGQG